MSSDKLIETSSVSPSEIVPLHTKCTFILAGFGALTSWNALMNTFSYYQSLFGIEVSFYYPLPLFLATNIFSILTLLLRDKVSIETRVHITVPGMMIMLVVLPLLAQVLPNSTGFYLSLPFMFINGAFSTVFQTSYISLANFFPMQCIPLYFTGTGLAGVLVSLLRILTLACFDLSIQSQLTISTIIYYAISIAILMVVYINHLFFIKSPYALAQINKYSQSPNIDTSLKDQQLLANDTISLQEQSSISVSPIQIEEDKNALLKSVCYKLRYYILGVIVIFLQTFTCFPGLGLEKNIFGLDANWTGSILVLTFNLGDMLSKYMCSFPLFHNDRLNTTLILSRNLFIVTFVLMQLYNSIPILSSSIFKVIHMFLFALLNGLCSTICMIMASNAADHHQKETAGFVMPFPLFFGIMLGSLISIGMSHIPQLN